MTALIPEPEATEWQIAATQISHICDNLEIHPEAHTHGRWTFQTGKKASRLDPAAGGGELRVCQSYLSMARERPKDIVARTGAKHGSRLQALAGFISAESRHDGIQRSLNPSNLRQTWLDSDIPASLI